jgi:hypothetical protein
MDELYRTTSRWPTPPNRILTDTDIDEKIKNYEAVPANRGPWVSVVYPGNVASTYRADRADVKSN